MKTTVAVFMISGCMTGLWGCAFKTDEMMHMTDLDASNLKGKIVQVKESYHKVGDACCPAGDKTECSQKITTYDANGFTLKSVKVGVEGDTIQYSHHIYNSSLECTAIENYSNNRLISREVNRLDNRLVKAVQITDESGNILNSHEFDYKNGLLTEGKSLNSDGKLMNSFINEYRAGKIETEVVKDSQGKILSITHNKRNNHGDVIESSVRHPRDNSAYVLNFEYVYDNEGNWIKQTKIYNEDIISIKIREIKYQ